MAGRKEKTNEFTRDWFVREIRTHINVEAGETSEYMTNGDFFPQRMRINLQAFTEIIQSNLLAIEIFMNKNLWKVDNIR